MKKNLTFPYFTAVCFIVLFAACRKDGMHSAMAKKIQYRWERVSNSSTTDYLDGRPVTWTVRPALPNTYLDFGSDGYFSDIYTAGSTKFQYKVDGDKILYLVASSTRATTPHYTDTAFINYVDDHLLVLLRRKYFISTAYNYIDLSIDSLKR